MKVIQTTISDRFEWIESLHFLLASKLITQHDFWLLIGNYVSLKELPSVEEDLPTNVKADLAIQRLLAKPNFRGIVANNPVIVAGFLRNVGAVLGEIKSKNLGGDA